LTGASSVENAFLPARDLSFSPQKKWLLALMIGIPATTSHPGGIAWRHLRLRNDEADRERGIAPI
jgi:hypothetical protein